MPNPITKKGYDNLLKKIEELKIEFEKMPEIIGTAREKGDLKENAEYHAARERQGMLQAEIGKLSGDFNESQVVDPKNLAPDIVTFGKEVKVQDLDSKNKLTFKIVGPAEADISNNEISILTPTAKGLLKHRVNDTANITVPAGTKKYKILEINYI